MTKKATNIATEQRPITSSDVARVAMVSQSTVSRVFSKPSMISPETRKRVMETAQQLGYRPSAIARSLASNKTGIVGIIVMRNSSPFYNHIINLLTATCRKKGYFPMIICQMAGESGTETVLSALDYRVDGLIMTAADDTNIGDIYTHAKVPIVLFNRKIDSIDVDSICCDNEGACGEVAEYLANKGHKTLACLMGDQNASTTKERLRGLSLKGANVGLQINEVQFGSYTYESGQEMCRELVSKGEELPDAIFCSGDIIAMGAIDTLRYEFNLKIPDDISIVGFDDIPEASRVAYALTTVRQPYNDLIDTTISLLASKICGERTSAVRAMYPCSIVERKTVKDLHN